MEGLNLQERTISIHHISTPWRQSDIEQRNGRIIRQGNINKKIYEYRYVIKNTFDAFIWQLIETKSRYVEQIMSGDKSIRSLEDVESPSMSAAETKAAACGDDRILTLAKWKREFKGLEYLESGFQQNKLRIHRQIKENEKSIQSLKEKLPILKQDILTMKTNIQKGNSIKLNEFEFSNMEELQEAFKQLVKADKEGIWGTIYGLEIFYDRMDKKLYIGSSNLWYVVFKKSHKTLLRDLLTVKDRIIDFYKLKCEKLTYLSEEYVKLKESLNLKFDQQDKLEKLRSDIKKLEVELLYNEKQVEDNEVASTSEI